MNRATKLIATEKVRRVCSSYDVPIICFSSQSSEGSLQSATSMALSKHGT
jgi:hypothetical protein